MGKKNTGMQGNGRIQTLAWVESVRVEVVKKAISLLGNYRIDGGIAFNSAHAVADMVANTLLMSILAGEVIASDDCRREIDKELKGNEMILKFPLTHDKAKLPPLPVPDTREWHDEEKITRGMKVKYLGDDNEMLLRGKIYNVRGCYRGSVSLDMHSSLEYYCDLAWFMSNFRLVV